MSKQKSPINSELVAKYNKLAKKADRRMRELERFSRYDEYKSILNYAYKRAVKDIASWTPPDQRTEFTPIGKDDVIYTAKKSRWQRNMPMDTRSLKAKIKDIENFLSKKTSTLTGVIDVYKKRAETINQRYGTNFTWQQLANYFETGFADKTSDKYGSKTVLRALGEIQHKKEEVVKALEDKVPLHIQVDNITVEDAANRFLRYYKKDLSKILN